MIVDGKQIASDILERLKSEVDELKNRNINPTLQVILIGQDPASLSYIKQKRKAAEKIGATLQFDQYDRITPEQLGNRLKALNQDHKVHGVIVQRPVPEDISESGALDCISIPKDIDGFLPGSPFTVPVARAVETILDAIFRQLDKNIGFMPWLQSQKIAVIGRGETAGRPIASHLGKLININKSNTRSVRLNPGPSGISVVHSRTRNRTDILKTSDIIISCVGREKIIRSTDIKPGAILVSVGLSRDISGKLNGDYDETEIATKAAFYTPTPGGVGPVNVACLMQNLLDATIRQNQRDS